MDVVLEGVTCQFGGNPAVHDIDLTIAEGEFMALVGPSGAGKTTLLRVIAGLQPDFSGRLSIGGRDMTGTAARDRNVGFVFQNYALFRHMTVRQNVAFGLSVLPRSRRPGRQEIAARVRELLQLVQIEQLAGRYPNQLSGGQQQRVALARALATGPGLLLLDEPFGALDPLIRKDIRTWLRGLHTRLGLTSILVTHDQEEAMDVADRLAVLRGGRLEQVGTPADLERQPVTAFVHRFLGETVSFSAITGGGFPQIAGPWAKHVRRLPPCAGEGAAVTLSIRPYEIGLVADEAAGASVVGLRPCGAYDRYQLRAAGEAAQLEALLPSTGTTFGIGSRVALDLTCARIFPGGHMDTGG